MKTPTRIAALLVTGIAAYGLPGMSAASAAATSAPITLYAAPSGAGGACTVARPCSLAGAAAKVRAVNHDMKSDIDVDLFGGDYRLASTLQLGPQDSGTNGFHVVYQPVPGQDPVLNGAARVTGFTRVSAADNVWRAPVSAADASSGGQQLFVDGTRATLARSAGSPADVQVTSTGFHTSDSSYASLTNQTQIQVVQDNDWKHMSCPVQSITADSAGGSNINVLPSCWSANNVNVPNLGFPFNGNGLPSMSGISYVENAYQLLDKPGQFYLDKAAHYLYYIPAPGQDMRSADVELPVLQTLAVLDGTPGHLSPVNQNDPGAAYAGSWATSANRSVGDLGDDVAYTNTNGDSVTYTFTGTGLEVLGETNTDEGTFDAYVDGKQDTSQNWTEAGSTRLAQQVVYSVQGLAAGTHTVKLVNTSSSYLVVDGFEVTPTAITPVHNITFQGLGFAYTTWNTPATTGYIDNQAAVLWDTSGSSTTPTITPGAVAVSRGADIVFSGDSFGHLGAAGIDLADGTQNSSIVGSTFTDTAAGGISVGDVNDYFQNDPALMNSGDTISDNAISHVGQNYTDAVGIWAGFTRNLTVSHNDIGHTSYSGMSIGWGWGWASPCSMQAAQGKPTCQQGTNYAGGNQVTDNYIHDVMNVLYDGGPIYTLGAQGEDGAGVYSVLSGNYVTVGNHTNNMLYQDEGSSYWHTFDNVTSYGGSDWIGMWTPTINTITVGPTNYTDNPNTNNNGTDITYTAPTLVAANAWPAQATAIMDSAGLDPAAAQGTVVDSDSQLLTYAGTWSAQGNYGSDDVHSTTAQGASVSLTFTGKSIAFVTDTGPGQGEAKILIDGVSQGTVNAASPASRTGQTVFTDTKLSAGKHTIEVVDVSGGMSLDSFQIPAQPYLTVTGSSGLYQPGVALKITATVTDPTAQALTDGQASLQVPQGWTLDKSQAGLPTVPAHGAASVTFTVTPPSTPPQPGTIEMTAMASYVAGHSGLATLVGTAEVVQPYTSFTAAFNNIGISDDTATDAADIDTAGSSFSAQALAALGVTPGKSLTYDGISFAWPNAASGQPDNVNAQGQTIDLSGSGADLGILDTATYGPAAGSGMITYTDGTTQTFTVNVPDWYGTAPAGSNAVIVAAYRNRPGNTQDHTAVNVFEQSVPLTAGKQVATVTLPDIGSGSTGLHVFALGIGN
ncbi:NEW3 domain-containing protein [Actinospica sp.]|uniref:NEW3 domain-containing protein n=1 Tax=Actinospica sp. TaxID=1872142 RepID=UPI002D0393C7|nr:NEW3 domain-containing protein [Actinospica sp.]HWG24219.1 NEW3 domain-containing protein [Actinospica sp.]